MVTDAQWKKHDRSTDLCDSSQTITDLSGLR
jgi:hypothetical protein